MWIEVTIATSYLSIKRPFDEKFKMQRINRNNDTFTFVVSYWPRLIEFF